MHDKYTTNEINFFSVFFALKQLFSLLLRNKIKKINQIQAKCNKFAEICKTKKYK